MYNITPEVDIMVKVHIIKYLLAIAFLTQERLLEHRDLI